MKAVCPKNIQCLCYYFIFIKYLRPSHCNVFFRVDATKVTNNGMRAFSLRANLSELFTRGYESQVQLLFAAGSSNEKVFSECSLCTVIFDPCISKIFFTMARPKPVPRPALLFSTL